MGPVYDILNRNRRTYARWLSEFKKFVPDLASVPLNPSPESAAEPFWNNGFFPGLDVLALHGFLCVTKPRVFLEIGSGHTTRFAARAIRQHKLPTRIISIDPEPRADVDALCAEVIRRRLEDADLSIFDSLDSGDIVFFDGSHHCFMGSDATVFFLEVMPRLKRGVRIQIHDICLPLDYPAAFTERYYSEQYLLAAFLLGGSKGYTIELPNLFVGHDPELNRMLEPVWRELPAGAEPHGESFWMRKTSGNWISKLRSKWER